jgi:hypothetical protein
VTCEAIQGRVGSKFRRAATVGRGGSARHLNLSALGPRMGQCVITARTLWRPWDNARGLGAGAVIAVLRGLRARRERRPIVATTIQNLGFVEVAGTVEPKAIAAGIARDAHNRVAEAVMLTLDWLEDEGNPLGQTQKIQFVECVLRCMDGFERATLDEIIDAIDKANHA